MAIVDQETDSDLIEHDDTVAPADVKRPWFASHLLWDLFPVVVSLVTSVAFIIRSVVFIGGQRFYVLFDDATISL